MRRSFLLWLIGLGMMASAARAQSPASQFGFVFGSVAKVVQGTDTLAQAWAGGLDTPQFSSIDLNGDGQQDLYAFDRKSARSYTFLSVAKAGGGRRYQYAPDYERIFPPYLVSWTLLRDYDCDGRADLFTSSQSGDIQVYHNVAAAGGAASFVLVTNQLDYHIYNFSANFNTGYYNVPAIQDLNGDGRLDILTYDFASSTSVELYLNASTESCGGISAFNRVLGPWAELAPCLDCASFSFSFSAPVCSTFRPAAVQHSPGHSMLMLDLNGDGKLDLLDGRDNCPQLTRLLNVGASTAAASFNPANTSTGFPSVAAPVNLPVFPAPYSLDATFDGVPDLLVAPAMVNNELDRISMRHNVLLYRNAAASAGAVPSFGLTTDSFLQSEMIDLSEGTMPTFGDIDGDGLTDMLVGNQGDLVNGYYRASLAYYRNVGTTARPVFRLVTEDYLGLAARAALTPTIKFETLRPTLADLNRDGALDLVYSAYTGDTNRLYYILNAASAGQPVSFNLGRASYFKTVATPGAGALPARQGDTPCFFDIDGDGYLDLLVGTNDQTESPQGRLRYFRNQGAAVQSNIDHLFVQANADYGTLRSSGIGPLNLAPAIADFDSDGTADLLTFDGVGTMRLYPDFRSQGASFLENTEVVYNSLSGQYEAGRLGQELGGSLRFAPAAADLNHDGKPELYVGTETGGIVSYLPRSGTALATHPAAAAALALSIYPNPAPQTTATVESAQPTRLLVYDLSGRLVQQDATLARSHSLALRGLAAGIYLVQATAADGTRATRRLAVE